MDYRVILIPDDNGTVLVSFPDFPEVHTFGNDEDEALTRALDAFETALEAYMKDKRAIPAPSTPKKKDRTMMIPAMVAAKIDLYRALRESKTTKSALARKLGWHVPQVDRLFNVRHQSKLEQLEAAAAALGKRLEVRVA
jgi:antitoxin HicB